MNHSITCQVRDGTDDREMTDIQWFDEPRHPALRVQLPRLAADGYALLGEGNNAGGRFSSIVLRRPDAAKSYSKDTEMGKCSVQSCLLTTRPMFDVNLSWWACRVIPHGPKSAEMLEARARVMRRLAMENGTLRSASTRPSTCPREKSSPRRSSGDYSAFHYGQFTTYIEPTVKSIIADK